MQPLCFALSATPSNIATARVLQVCFSEGGVYHDAFYGAFAGRAKIAELIDDWFYRTAHDFRWDMHEPVTDGHTLYARYAFSYVSRTLPEAQGRRVAFEGVSIIKLRDGLIVEYREVANVGPALVALGFAPERVCKILAREGKRLRDAAYARIYAQSRMNFHVPPVC